MQFKVIISDQVYAIEVPEDLLRDATEFHAKLDRDMDRGWQMSREFVEPALLACDRRSLY